MGRIYLVAILSGAIMLFCFGYIGPKGLRKTMRKFNRWYWHDSSLLLPVQPDKPILSSINEGVHNFWPSKERLREILRYATVIFAVVAISTIISIVIVAHLGY